MDTMEIANVAKAREAFMLLVNEFKFLLVDDNKIVMETIHGRLTFRRKESDETFAPSFLEMNGANMENCGGTLLNSHERFIFDKGNTEVVK